MSLQCWKCGATLTTMLPLSRTETCPSCRAALHVCRLCRHFDPSRAGQCREPAADPVAAKMRANGCGWFVPRPDAYQGGGSAIARQSRGALDVLFCGASGASQKGSALFSGASGASHKDSALSNNASGDPNKDAAKDR